MTKRKARSYDMKLRAVKAIVDTKAPMLDEENKAVMRAWALKHRIETAETLERDATWLSFNRFWLSVFLLMLCVTATALEFAYLAVLGMGFLIVTALLTARHNRAVLGLREAIAFAKGPLT